MDVLGARSGIGPSADIEGLCVWVVNIVSLLCHPVYLQLACAAAFCLASLLPQLIVNNFLKSELIGWSSALCFSSSGYISLQLNTICPQTNVSFYLLR